MFRRVQWVSKLAGPGVLTRGAPRILAENPVVGTETRSARSTKFQNRPLQKIQASFLRADFWEGDATKHFSVKKRGFQ